MGEDGVGAWFIAQSLEGLLFFLGLYNEDKKVFVESDRDHPP